MEAKYSESIKKPGALSPRVRALREWYFEGAGRSWNNEYLCFTTGTPWDKQFNELTYFIVPETYTFFDTFTRSSAQAAKCVAIPENFFSLSIPERVALFNKLAITEHAPVDILPGDLLCGANFNMLSSMCLTKSEQRRRDALTAKARESAFLLYYRGYGNSGSTSGHLIPDYEYILKHGFEGRYAQIKAQYDALSDKEKRGKKGANLRAMLTACETPRLLAERYAAQCRAAAEKETDDARREELLRMAQNMDWVPWHGARDFYEAVQSLWLTHMLVMTDENYPGPGVSFGRLDQYMLPYYEISAAAGMSREFMKEILGCFWFHCNTAYDAQIGEWRQSGHYGGLRPALQPLRYGAGRKGYDKRADMAAA